MSHIWISHGTRETCHTYEWVMSHKLTDPLHVQHMKESQHTYQRSVPHSEMRHVIHVESWHTYEWVTAHAWISHGTRRHESLHTTEKKSNSADHVLWRAGYSMHIEFVTLRLIILRLPSYVCHVLWRAHWVAWHTYMNGSLRMMSLSVTNSMCIE